MSRHSCHRNDKKCSSHKMGPKYIMLRACVCVCVIVLSESESSKFGLKKKKKKEVPSINCGRAFSCTKGVKWALYPGSLVSLYCLFFLINCFDSLLQLICSDMIVLLESVKYLCNRVKCLFVIFKINIWMQRRGKWCQIALIALNWLSSLLKCWCAFMSNDHIHITKKLFFLHHLVVQVFFFFFWSRYKLVLDHATICVCVCEK